MDVVPIEELLQHRRWLSALARGLVSDPEVAREVEQETWLVAVRNPPKDRRNLRGWLARVAANRVHARWRRRALAGPLESDVPTDLDPAEMAAQVEVARVLAGHVLALDEPYRTTVLLRFWHGLDSPAIARREGIAAGTVRWRLKVALDQLRASLAEQRGSKTWATFLAPLVRQPGPASFSSLVALLWLPLLLPTAAAVAFIAAAVTLLAPTPNEPEPHRVAALPSTPEFVEPPPTPEALAASIAPITATTTTDSTAQRTEVVPLVTETASRPVGVARGRLVSNDGQPIAGGQVRLTYTPNHIPANWTEWTDADYGGRFEIPLPRVPDRTFETLSAEFRAPFHVERSTTAAIPASQVVEFGAVELTLGARVEGVVLTVDGLPLAGATVTARDGGRDGLRMLRMQMEHEPFSGSGRDSSSLSAFPNSVSTTSGADGRYRLEGVAAGIAVVAASAPCHASGMTASFRVSDGESTEAPSLVLEPVPPETYLRGVVLDPDGNPVPDATVTVYRSSPGTHTHSDLITDENGEFWECGLITGILTVEATHDLWAPSVVAQVRPGTGPVELRLRALRRIRLRVASDTGELLGDVHVTQLRETSRSSYPALAVADEDWMEFWLPPEPVHLHISAPQHHELDLGVIDPREQRDVLEVTLKRVATARCTGRIVDTDGAPVEGALVGLVQAVPVAGTSNGFPTRSLPTSWLASASRRTLGRNADAFFAQSSDVALSDEHGNWSFPVEKRGRYYLHVRAPGWSLMELGPVRLSPQRAHDFGEIRLTRGGGLRGRVLDENGAPSAHAVVAISRGDGTPSSTRTDADGYYVFENLTPGPWFVRTQSEEVLSRGTSFQRGAHATPMVFNTAVVEGESTAFDLVATTTPRVELAVAITVDGEPAVGWEVYLRLDGLRQAREGLLDESGSMSWSWVQDSSEEAVLFVESPGGVRIGREVKLADLAGPFVLDIQTGELVLHGVPLEEDDVAPTGAYCKFDGWIVVALPISEDGTWRARVPAGEWRVVRGDEGTDVEDPDELPALNSGTLVPGGVLELHLP